MSLVGAFSVIMKTSRRFVASSRLHPPGDVVFELRVVGVSGDDLAEGSLAQHLAQLQQLPRVLPLSVLLPPHHNQCQHIDLTSTYIYTGNSYSETPSHDSRSILDFSILTFSILGQQCNISIHFPMFCASDNVYLTSGM